MKDGLKEKAIGVKNEHLYYPAQDQGVGVPEADQTSFLTDLNKGWSIKSIKRKQVWAYTLYMGLFLYWAWKFSLKQGRVKEAGLNFGFQ